MEIIETKVIHTKIKIFQAREEPLVTFGSFKDTRNRLNLGVPTKMHKCLLCGHRFKDDEMVWLAIASHGNRFVCEECNKKILKQLKEEQDESK